MAVLMKIIQFGKKAMIMLNNFLIFIFNDIFRRLYAVEVEKKDSYTISQALLVINKGEAALRKHLREHDQKAALSSD